MVRLVCALIASLALACSATWESHVTFVRPGACATTVGGNCVYTYESETIDQPGRCDAQQLPAGARLVACREHQERRASTTAIVLGFLSPLVIVAVVLGLASLAPGRLE